MESTDFDPQRVWQAILRRRLLIAGVTLVSVLATAAVVYSMRPVFEARALVLIEREAQNTIAQEGIKVDFNNDYFQTQYEILKSRTMAERVAQDLSLERHPDYAGDPAGIVQNTTSVLPVKRSRLIHVVAEAYDPTMAATIANTLAERFIEQNLESRLYLSREMLRILAPRGGGGASIESLPAVVNNPLIQQLKIRQAELQTQRAEMAKNFQERHPSMMQIQAQLQETRAQIDRETTHIAESVKIQLSGQLQGNNVRVVDPARPPSGPSKPRKSYSLTVALAAGLLVGIVLALIIDQLDLTIRNQEDFEHFLKAPCLAVVGRLMGVNPAQMNRLEAVWSDARSQAAENFRNLRTAVSFRLSNVRGPSVLLVTSSVQGEGKSFISSNMARAFAQNGERVLLIDGDLRRPRLHQTFELNNESGLSSYLTGQGAPAQFLRDPGVPNLKIMPCGPMPDNPAELLTDQRLKPLIAWAVGEFDRVIVDSPPVFPVTDALLWSKQVHGVVFVVQAGKVRVTLVQRAIQNLRDSFANVLGGVLNQMSSAMGDSYYGYYNYYYKYETAKESQAKVPAEA